MHKKIKSLLIIFTVFVLIMAGFVVTVSNLNSNQTGDSADLNIAQTLAPSINYIMVGKCPQGIMYDDSNGLIYVANHGSNNITIINPNNNGVEGSINNLPSGPREFAFDTDTNQILVTDVGVPVNNNFGNYVTVINVTNNRIVQNIYIGQSPWGIAFDPSNGLVYVSDVPCGGLVVLQPFYNETSHEYNFEINQTINVGFWPETVIYDPSNNFIYVAVTGPGPSPGSTNYIDVVSARNNTVVAEIPVIGNPEALTYDSYNNYIYAGVFEDQIFVINGADNAVIKTINISAGDCLRYIPQGNFVLTDNNSSVDVLNASSGIITGKIQAVGGAWGILYHEQNNYLYVSDSNSSEVSFSPFIPILTSNVTKENYTVTFTESGLSSETSWSVTFNGISESSTTNAITFSLPNGTYSYTIKNVSGYSALPSTGSIKVNGNNKNQGILFKPLREIRIYSKYSGFLYENISLIDIIGVYSQWGSSFPVSVNGSMNGLNISLLAPANQDDPWNYTFPVRNLPKTNSVTVYAHYQNGSIVETTYNFTAVSIPSEVASLLTYSKSLKVYTNSSEEWHNSYNIQASILLNLPTIATVNISKLPVIGGNYLLLPSVKVIFNLSSTGRVSLSAGLSAQFNEIDIGPVGISAHFGISAMGIVQIINDSLIFKQADLFIDVGGSFSVNVPTPFGFNVSGIGVGLFLTFIVSPNVAVKAIISATDNTSREFIKGLGIAIDNITSNISVPFTVEGTLSAAIASASLGGTITVNFNLSSGSPLMKGGSLTGLVFITLHALFWSDQIDMLGPGTLYSWNATDPVFNNANYSGSFVITREYWNVSGYNSIVWKNGSAYGTIIHDIYPQTSISSLHSGSSSYFAYTYDNVSRNITKGLEIKGFIFRNHNYYPWNIPVEGGYNTFSPVLASLPNGSILLVWHSLPFNESTISPLSWNYIPVQYAYFNPSTGTWSSIMNLTTSGVAQSVAVSVYSHKVMVSIDVSNSLFSNYSYLEIYNLAIKSIDYESKLPTIASISGYSAKSSIVILKYINGKYEALNVSSNDEIALPSFGNYTISQVGITGNTNSTLYILFRSNSSSLAALYDPYHSTILRMIKLNNSVKSISFRRVDLSYVLILTTVNSVNVYQLSSNALTSLNQYASSNITGFSTLTYGNTLQVYWLYNYGNQSEPLVNLNIAYLTIAYNVTFTESNLPSGSTWYVNLSNGMKSGPITGSSYTFSLTNGFYSYTIATSDKIYEPSHFSGSIAVNGKNMSQLITFTKVTYLITFAKFNLPPGSLWYINITESNGTTYHSGSLATSSYSLDLTNGSYTYTIATNNKIYHADGGSFTVNGNTLTEPITFSKVTYSTTFKETGLPSGTVWYVMLSNGMSAFSLNNTVSFDLTNGSYSYNIGTSDHTYSPSAYSGNVTVNGKPVSEPITFSKVLYSVTFTESNLPAGSRWILTFNNVKYTLTNTSYTFHEINGTYFYHATSTDYMNISGYVSVKGSAKQIDLSFKLQTYSVTFKESGLQSGSMWYVNLSNGVKSGPITGSSYSFTITNGSYSYTIGNTSGYETSNSTGTMSVNGKNVTENITFSKVTSNTDLYIIIGAASAAVIVAVAAVVIWRRK